MRLSNIALYDKNTTDFFDQGLGILSDAISSESTEEVQDNGNITYEMVLKYPIGGVLSDQLKLPNLIRAQESEDPNDFMIFEIYDYDEDDEGEMTVYAQAMPYRVLRLPFNDDSKFPTKYKNIQELMDYAVSRVTGFPSWFKITSDIIVANNLSFDAGNAQFENLGKFLDTTLSLIDASVEYKWNRINILDSRGRDLSDIVLRDDKNTNGIKITGSYEKIINKVVPIIRNRNETTGEFEDGTHMGSVVTSKDPFKWIPYYAGVTATFDSQEEANNYISSNKLDNPAITVDVTPLMVDEDLTQVHTFDRITAYSTKLKYQDTLQVTTRVFDQLNAEVVSFKMGSIKKDINSTTSYTLSSLASEIARAQNIAGGAARSADGKNKVYFPGSNPTDPSEGDLWFHKIDGKDVGEQYINGEWVTIIKDSMGEEIRSYVDQKMLENNDAMDKLHSDLESNAQIVTDNKQAVDDAMGKLHADLESNSQTIKDNKQALDDAMGKLHADLESNSQTIKDNKQAVDEAMIKVNEDLTKAKSDAESAVQKADDAVTNAQSAVKASGLATTTANAANDAATAAKDLATSTANAFDGVRSQASTAASDSANALSNANDAMGKATTAIDNASDALTQAKSALATANGVQNSMQPAITAAVDTAKGELTASIQTISSNVDAISTSQGRNYVKNSRFEQGTLSWDLMGSGLQWDTSSAPQARFLQPGLHMYADGTTLGTYNGISQVINLKMIQGQPFVVGALQSYDGPYENGRLNVGVHFLDSDGNILDQKWTSFDADPNQDTVYRRQSTVFYAVDETVSIRLMLFATGTNPNVYVTEIYLKVGSAALGWSEAPEDAQQQITTNATNITANSKEIALAAKQSVVDTLAQQVTDNTSQLKLTATAASLEVTSKKVDTLSQTVTDQGAKLDLTATSAQLEVTEKKVDALNQTVSDNSAQLKLTATSAALETQSQRVDTISGQVDTNTAAITTANGEIELKANSSTVDDLSNTVKQQGIDLKAAQGELALKLTQSDLTKGLDGYATQTWAQNQITATAQGWETQLSSVQAQYNDIGQSQGRNYIRNSRFESHMDNWSVNAGDGALTIDTTHASQTYLGKPGLHIFGTTTSGYQGIAQTVNLKLKKGQKFVIGLLQSFDGPPSQGTLNIGVHYRDASNTILSQEWHDYTCDPGWDDVYWRNSIVYTAADDCDNMLLMIYAIHENFSLNAYLTEVSLTVGPTSFGWQPAPEDTATYTDAKVADLKLTVDGFSTTFAKQTDLESTNSNLKAASEGLSFVTAVTGTKGEHVTQVIADVKNIKTTMTGENGYTTRLQTLEGFQQTATDKLATVPTQSQLTQVSDKVSSVVGQLGSLQVGGENLLLGTGDYSGWGKMHGDSTTNMVVEDGTGIATSVIHFCGANTQGLYGTSGKVDLVVGQTYTVTITAKYYSGTPDGTKVPFELACYSDYTTTQENGNGIQLTGTLTDSWVRYSGHFTCKATGSYGNWLFGNYSTTPYPGGSVYIAEIKLEASSVGSAWCLARSEQGTASQITQLQNQIDLRTTVAGKVTAALNLSNDGGGTVTIRGASLYVTADSHFDDASIKSASIASLDATKITSGSISADRLATTDLNADNITSGSISADRLATTQINADNITSGSISADRLATTQINADNITSGSINADLITTGSIRSERLATTKLNADNITSGSIAAERLATTKLNADNITSGSINAELITTGKLSADRIWGGTLNGYLMDIVNINANNITTGTISGANLAINLTTGDVKFQSGRIHDKVNRVDINIDPSGLNSYLSVANGNNRVLLKGGELQFIQPTLFDLQKTPYLSISNQGSGSNWAGATFVGRDSVVVANSANVGSSIIDWQLGQNDFAGLMAGKNSNGDWDPTIVGGANRGVVISGGAAFTGGLSTVSITPFIHVGTDPTGVDNNGTRIMLYGQYVYSPSTYMHTMSGSANVIVASDGALVRTSSATKYKSDITRFRSTEMAEKLIRLPQAHWYNKEDMKRYSENPDHYSMPKMDYGMIAEDIAGAGLEDLVSRGEDGELEDVRYDRMAAVLLPLIASMKQEIEELKGE